MPRTRTGVVWFLQHSTNIPPVTFGAHVGTSPRHNHQKKFWGYRDYHGTTTLAVYNGIRNHAYPSPLSIILVNTSDPFIQAWFCVHWNVYACVVLSCDICVVYISADSECLNCSYWAQVLASFWIRNNSVTQYFFEITIV